MYNKKQPRFIIAKYTGVCAETGLAIYKGDTCLYAGGKVYHESSDYYRQMRELEFARAYNMGDKDW